MKKESKATTVGELWRGELKPIAGATGVEEVTYHHDERLLHPVSKVFMSMVISKTEKGATYDFETDTTDSVAEIAIEHPEVLQNRDIHISPIRWRDGHRREQSFSCASFLMGEVDGG